MRSPSSRSDPGLTLSKTGNPYFGLGHARCIRSASGARSTFRALTFSFGPVSDVTRILDSIQRGEPKASEELLPLVYEELRKLAAQKLAQEPAGQTLQATALVHEAWLRLSGGEERQWENRRHFFGAAAEAMRRILIDNARRKHAVRHGGGQRRTNLEDVDLAAPSANE